MVGWPAAMDDRETRELRRALLRAERGRGKRLPAALRTRAAAWIRRQRSGGATLREICAELPLCYETARRWAALPAPTAPVRVAVAPPLEAEERALVLVSPGGFRVEGATVQQTIAILRELG